MSVVVWSKPRCVQCTATKRWLDGKKIDYEVKNLPDHPDAVEAFKALNLMQAPITEIEGHDPFSGFNPTLLEEYLVTQPEAKAGA